MGPTSPRETPRLMLRPILNISLPEDTTLLLLPLPQLLLQSLLPPTPLPTLPRPPSNTLAVRSPLSTVLTTPRSSWSQSRSSTATPSPRSPVPPSTTRSPPPSASPSPPSICHMPLMLLHTSTESNFNIYHHLRHLFQKPAITKLKSFLFFIHSVRKKSLITVTENLNSDWDKHITLLTLNSEENAAISKVYKTACG